MHEEHLNTQERLVTLKTTMAEGSLTYCRSAEDAEAAQGLCKGILNRQTTMQTRRTVTHFELTTPHAGEPENETNKLQGPKYDNGA